MDKLFDKQSKTQAGILNRPNRKTRGIGTGEPKAPETPTG